MATLVSLGVALAVAAAFNRLHGSVLWGFVAVFILASSARFVSALMFMRMEDPRPGVVIERGSGLVTFFRNIRKTSLGKFTLYAGALYIGASIGGSFFTVYLLRELGFSDFTYIVGFTAVSSVS